MTDKELDDLFQKAASGHQMPVPPDMWQRVNPQKDKRRRAAFFWWSGLGMAALVMLIGAGIWLYHTPSGKAQVAVAKQTGNQQTKSSLKNGKPLPSRPAEIAGISDQIKATDEASSARDAQRIKDDISNQEKTISYSHKDDVKQGRNFPSGQQNATVNHTNELVVNEQGHIQKPDKGLAQGNGWNSNSENNNAIITSPYSGDVSALSNRTKTSAQKPDSSAIANSDNATKPEATTAVKVKKIHGEKATGFELMVSGYGNSRHVYDASQLSTAGIFAFGPINQKEKVLMQSISINARVDKPLTKNFSVKTGLQYMQTRQRVSYRYETVSQRSIVNAVTADTTVSASLQSNQFVIKGTYNSLSVPVLVNYHTNGNKMNLGATAGVVMNVLSWYNGKVPDESTKQTVVAKNIFRIHTGASLYAGVTASKQVGKLQLFAEPHVQYTLSSVTKSTASFRQKMTSYGFGIGIRKTIGK